MHRVYCVRAQIISGVLSAEQKQKFTMSKLAVRHSFYAKR